MKNTLKLKNILGIGLTGKRLQKQIAHFARIGSVSTDISFFPYFFLISETWAYMALQTHSVKIYKTYVLRMN